MKNPTKEKIKNPDSPWRERFHALSLDENNLHHIDDRLVILKIFQAPIKNSLHWGHPRRDHMLQQTSDIWLPRIHRDITLLANWEQLAQDSTDEEEESQRQKLAVKAAVVWEKPTKNRT